MNYKKQTALVVGGGPAGMEASIKIAQAGYKVVLVEKMPVLGGVLGQLHSSFPHWENPQDLLDNKVKQIGKLNQITVLTGMTVKSVSREDGFYLVGLQGVNQGDDRILKVDAVVLATGFEMFDASVYGEYGYGIYPDVLDSLEFEAKLKEWGSGQGQRPQAVAFFKCVGSRDRSKGNPYCSKVCCMYTAKQAGIVKDMFPDAKAYVFYMDYRAAGRDYEEFTREVIEEKHVRYVRGRPSKVVPENGKLLVRAEDTLMGVPIEVEVDMVVLASAVVPSKGTKELAGMFGAATDQYGFLLNNTFNPGKATDRVFFAGACGFAVELQGALYQGAAAAADVIGLFNSSAQGGD